MTDQISNPISLIEKIIESHRGFLKSALSRQGISEPDTERILENIDIDRGLFISLNRRFKAGAKSFRQFCEDHTLSSTLPNCFYGENCIEKLYVHQEKAIEAISSSSNTILSTGTGSGKTEAFLIPILDYCLKNPGPGVKALILYPMNALANDQLKRLEQAVVGTPLRFGLFVGSTTDEERQAVRYNPPDILVTNYSMLEWMLTRTKDRAIFKKSATSLKFIVLDEIHTYRGNKATHLKYLIARLKDLVNGPITHIGTSATLQTRHTSGQAIEGRSDQLDQFILPLLEIQDYVFIQPEYELDDIEPNSGNLTPINPQELNWQFDLDPTMGLKLLNTLTSHEYQDFDIACEISQSRPYQDFQRNPIINCIRKSLNDHGAQSLSDLVNEIIPFVPEKYPLEQIDVLVKAYLSCIAFFNFQSKVKPFMDLRFHLFLCNIDGYLKRCLKCGRYHTGRQDYCPDCGYPLFFVYRKDIRACIGKISNHHLHWNLWRETDDQENPYYVLVSREKTQVTQDTVSFQEQVQSQQRCIDIKYDEYGDLKIQLIPGINSENVFPEGISLNGDNQSEESLYELVKTLLMYQNPRHRKLLGFIDSREQASRFSAVFQHRFANDFFEAFLRSNYQTGRKWSIKDTYESYMAEWIPSIDEVSYEEQNLFNEFRLWFCQWINTPPRIFPNQPDFLRIKESDHYSDLEKKILQVFLDERAIDLKYNQNADNTHYIRFRKYLATQPAAIHLDDASKQELRQRRTISLGENSNIYREFVKEHGTAAIGLAIQDLADRKILVKEIGKDGRTYFYLSTKHIYLELPDSQYEDYAELRRDLFLIAEVHSSEVENEKRVLVESEFRTGMLNVLVATPTLELGIDIGDLNMVLLIGVPPSPSNYTQRAGRAGRKSAKGNTLIVTYCDENSDHDNHYFHFPKEMINGVVAPPQFNPANMNVVRKHVNAFLLAEQIETSSSFRHFLSSIDTITLNEDLAIQKVFKYCPDAVVYARHQFRQALEDWFTSWRNLKTTHSPRQKLYSTGFFPDYSFRHDLVRIFDLADRNRAENQDLWDSSDWALTEQVPESARTKLAPGENLFMAGDPYKITSIGSYTVLGPTLSPEMRSYEYLFAEKEVWFASENKIYNKYDLKALFDVPEIWVDQKQVLSIAYLPECKLRFVNQGKITKELLIPFEELDKSEENTQFQIGYSITRQVFILRFDKLICNDERLYLSLSAALIRVISEYYKVDEDDLGLVVDPKPFHEELEPPDSQSLYLIIYDFDGNANIPFDIIQANFMELVQIAYDKIRNCPGNGENPCEDGCYFCLRSYNNSRSSKNISKNIALMFLGYLLGKNVFEPALPQPPMNENQLDLCLSIKRSGRSFVVYSTSREYLASIDQDQNETLFNLLAQAVQTEYKEGMRKLLIKANEDYIISAINEGNLRQSKDAFARFQFQTLRFDRVKAQRGDK